MYTRTKLEKHMSETAFLGATPEPESGTISLTADT